MRGRSAELATLTTLLHDGRATVALVGAGGTGKSMLAAALAYDVARERFAGARDKRRDPRTRMHWFRIGAWDHRTLLEMLALRFGTSRDRHRVKDSLRRFLSKSERVIVLDNHEDDEATAALLSDLAGTRATFILTARRCLLAGVLIYPVTAPLVTSGVAAFPAVATLTRMLRFSPLALDIADAIVATGVANELELGAWLEERGVSQVRVIDHEDDLPEVALLVAWAFERLSVESRRALVVVAHDEGDHMSIASIGALGSISRSKLRRAVDGLLRFHLVQETRPGRFTVHAVVRHAVKNLTRSLEPEALGGPISVSPQDQFRHYIELLERRPEQLVIEQTHLFAAMDHANRGGHLDAMLRIEALLSSLD